MRETLIALRKLMAERGIDTYIVLSEDAHQSEYVAPYWRARAFMSGFTGSAGTLAVTAYSAYLWTDGRYFLQGEAQLQGSGISLMKAGEPGVPGWADWVRDVTKEGGKVGIDGRTLGAAAAKTLERKFAAKHISIACEEDLVGLIWNDRPQLPTGEIFELSAEYSGETRAERLARLRAHMDKIGAEAYLVCSLESSAWLLNYRGSDVEDTPVAYAYTLVEKDKATLFIEPEKVPEALKKAFEADGVVIRSYHEIQDALKELRCAAIAYDASMISLLLLRLIPQSVKRIEEEEAPMLYRAVKNETECANLREAHIKDGAVMVRFIRKLKEDMKNGRVMREDEAADDLDALRWAEKNSLGPSFGTIAGYESNGAIVHYSAPKGAGALLRPEGFLLVDSGAQYLEGTTDITRTIALGPIDEKRKEIYTLVLKGHIALGCAAFPQGTPGPRLDVLARKPLWERGLDFKHGTGHGVGYLLSVHEGPHRINQGTNNVALVPGMVVSNEPGFYETNEFGVRTENLVLVKEKETTEWGNFLEFETLTLCPYERDAIKVELLDETERAWVNAYHKRVRETLAPRLSGADLDYLIRATEAI